MTQRATQPLDFLTSSNTDADVSAIEQSLGITPPERQHSVQTPTANPLVDLQGAQDFERAPASRAAEEAAVEKQNADTRNALDFRDFYTNVVGNDFSISALMDMAREDGFDFDPDYQLPELNSEDFKRLTRDIPPEHWEVFENVVSADHAEWIASKTRRELEAEGELAAYGGLGIAGRIALNLLDPVGVAIGAATGGLGWASKGTRITRALKAGGLAGAENAALQAALSDQRAEQDGWDIANAAFAGFALGGLSSRFLGPKSRDDLALTAERAQRALDRAEAEDMARAAGIDLSGTNWRDSGGAARVDASALLRPLREFEDGELEPIADVGQSAFAKARFDIAATLRGDEDEYVRGTLGLMVGEPVGVKSGVNHIGASERAQRLQDAWLTAFYDTAEPAYARWGKAKGHSALDLQTRSVRDEFMSTVGRWVRGSLDTDDENIIAAGKVVRERQAEILRRAKSARVDGFDDVPENANYLSRAPNLRKWRDYEQRFGTGKMEQAIEEAMTRKASDIDPHAAKLIAKGYVKRLKMQAAGFDAEILNGIRLTDVDYIRGLLKDVQADSDTVEYVAKQLQRSLQDRGTGSSSVSHGKRRVSLDEAARFKLTDQTTGDLVDIGIDDIFDSNVERLFSRYARTMAGHISLAEVAQIRGRRDFEHVKQTIRAKNEYASESRRVQVERLLKTADDVYKLVTGVPIEDAAEWQQYARLVRDVNFTRVMNQSGFAQVADVAGWLAGGYAREAVRHLPALKSILQAAKAGHVEPTLARELKLMLSVATDFHNNTAFSFGDEMFADGLTGAVGKLQHAARIGGRVTQRVSGMKFMNELRRSCWTTRWDVRTSLKGGFSTWDCRGR